MGRCQIQWGHPNRYQTQTPLWINGPQMSQSSVIPSPTSYPWWMVFFVNAGWDYDGLCT